MTLHIFHALLVELHVVVRLGELSRIANQHVAQLVCHEKLATIHQGKQGKLSEALSANELE